MSLQLLYNEINEQEKLDRPARRLVTNLWKVIAEIEHADAVTVVEDLGKHVSIHVFGPRFYVIYVSVHVLLVGFPNICHMVVPRIR